MSAGKHAKSMQSTRTIKSTNLSSVQTHIKLIQLEAHSRQAHVQSYCLMYYISETIFVLNPKDTKPVNIYFLKVNNGNTRTMCDISSNLTIKTPERHQWHSSGVFGVNFERISRIVLVFSLLTLNKYTPLEKAHSVY